MADVSPCSAAVSVSGVYLQLGPARYRHAQDVFCTHCDSQRQVRWVAARWQNSLCCIKGHQVAVLLTSAVLPGLLHTVAQPPAAAGPPKFVVLVCGATGTAHAHGRGVAVTHAKVVWKSWPLEQGE